MVARVSENMDDNSFLLELRQYIETKEVAAEAEYGFGRSLDRLIAEGEMPPIYAEVLKRLGSVLHTSPVQPPR
jgi:hypothetical protein